MYNKDNSDKKRVMIFIDGSNFYHSCKSAYNIHHYKIDFAKLIKFLLDNKMLVKVCYYNAPLDRGKNAEHYWEQQKFFDYLRKIPGFEVILCRMRKDKNNDGSFSYVVKGDDIHIASDMVGNAYEDSYDIAILVSGDGDFVPAIQRVRKRGKKVYNAYFNPSFSAYLKKICDKSIHIDKNTIEKCIKEE